MSMTCIVTTGILVGVAAYLAYCVIQIQSEADKQISESLARAEEAERIANQNSLELAKYRRAADELFGCEVDLERANAILRDEEALFAGIDALGDDENEVPSEEETVDHE